MTDEQGALGAYLGVNRLQRLRQLAIRAAERREVAGRVVFVPGFLGTALVVTREGESRTVWLDHQAIRDGWFRWLRLATDGRSSFDPGVEVRTGGLLNTVYSEILLGLAARWDVRAFAYDWRKDLDIAAAELEAFILAEFGDAPIRLVAHSSGATVVRAMFARKSETGGGADIERLVALGEPGAGTFVVPRILAGVDPIVTRLGCWTAAGMPGQGDLAASREVAKAFASFPALYQMLPRPSRPAPRSRRRGRSLDAFYRVETYASCPVVVPAAHLEAARVFAGRLEEIRDDGLVPIARVQGYGLPTPVGLDNVEGLGDLDGYAVSWRGDGVIECEGTDRREESEPGRYCVRVSHAGLAADASVLGALDGLLEEGCTDRLRPNCPGADEPVPAEPGRGGAGRDEAFGRLVRRLVARDVTASRALSSSRIGTRLREAAERVSPDERDLENRLAGSFHASESAELGPGDEPPDGSPARPVPAIAVSLVHAGIEAVERLGQGGRDSDLLTGYSGHRFLEALRECPIDAIAVGHYLGVPPEGPELALDRSISRAVHELETRRIRDRGPDASDLTPEEGLVLTQYAQRGILRGELGQPFFLHDPRATGGAEGRLIVIAGMGLAGRFGPPELTVLARELCWSLGRLGKRHLATVLIGAGEGNIPLRDAVHAWLRGIAQALNGVAGRHPHVERITFVECNAGRLEDFNRSLEAEVGRIGADLIVEYTPKTSEELETAREHTRATEHGPHRHRHHDRDAARRTTRVTVQIEGETYRFGALTGTASIPERSIPLRRTLVDAANNELATEARAALQLERGQFLGRLLIPVDLRPQFFTRDPLVLMLDASTARIHWEMMAQAEGDFAPGERPSGWGGEGRAPRFAAEYFLGTARGLTRQLRTTFAPPPEPPPPPRRVLRVLVVADPAADAPLPGALAEGAEVADLFEAFNGVHRSSDNRVEVVRLLGPGLATVTNVLRELTSRPYDVCHFAGHCFFDSEAPTASGWVFSGAEVLTADLLNRIDRVPKFVFSNACESGVTPDRPGGYSDRLSPSFAEAFFQRGVSNFVCTAWPVDDLAARRFADRLYRGLLGLRVDHGSGSRVLGPGPFEPIHQAMMEARLTVACQEDGAFDAEGARTWGAYQHYGDPFFRFFHQASFA